MTQPTNPESIYRDEALELLSSLEESLLELDENPGRKDLVNTIFRSLHTIKGSGAMFGFDEIARFTHEIENTFDAVREGRLALEPSMITLTLKAKDHIHDLLNMAEPDAAAKAHSDELLTKFRALTGGAAAPEAPVKEQVQQVVVESEELPRETFWIRYIPTADSFLTGTDPLRLILELFEIGAGDSLFTHQIMPGLEEMDPERAFGFWDVIISTARGVDAIRDVFIFVEDDHDITIEKIGDDRPRGNDVNDMLECLSKAADPKAALREMRQTYAQNLAKRNAEPEEQSAARTETKSKATSLRVDAARLDRLVNMVGELIILQTRLNRAAGRHEDDPDLHQIAEELERLSDEMRDDALGLRMVPISTSFGSMRRLVRDISDDIGKEVEFVTEGGETELDKNVIEEIKGPLMHIMRNAIDHGLETPERRREAGKAEAGVIRLSARHASGDVLIEIADDGAGIDAQKVRGKAIERGLITPEQQLTEPELLNLIFEPGFSTADQVSDLSGRGVGMDVVRRGVDALRGSVEIQSELGMGTTVRMRIPLTLAIIDGLHVRVGGELYILPMSAVESCQERFVDGPTRIIEKFELRDKMAPCISLRNLLQVEGEQPDYERIVVTEADGMYVGLAVDAVLGQQHAVIKSLDESCNHSEWIAGTTINGDGGISIILDVPQLVRFANRQHNLQ
ncbi:chemotaxis protein CheA [Oceanidesulfovibrio marinus]|nr:chemotaxis protein CheA [Oceanidesulfovibrio marinus]